MDTLVSIEKRVAEDGRAAEYAAWGVAAKLDDDRRDVAEAAIAREGVDGLLDLLVAGEAHGGLGADVAEAFAAALAEA